MLYPDVSSVIRARIPEVIDGERTDVTSSADNVPVRVE